MRWDLKIGFIVIGVSIVALGTECQPATSIHHEWFLPVLLPYTMLYNWAYDVLRQRMVTPPAARWCADIALFCRGSQRSGPPLLDIIGLKTPQLTLFGGSALLLCVFIVGVQ